MEYFYPDNLNAEPLIGFWNMRDTLIIGCCLVVSLIVLFTTWLYLPLVFTMLYAFLAMRLSDADSIFGYILRLMRFVMTEQQLYKWQWR